jgi:L-seryl-tRNA(Ser) seleniumtransferase
LQFKEGEAASPDLDVLIDQVILRALSKNEMSLKRVVNATGIILHTNLGRALLSGVIKDKVWEIAENYSTLEYDVQTGKRGSRYDHVESLITKITGAEAAFVVNNNAAAVLLALSTFAKGEGVVVSRGELVEIGESFRLPEILEQSGARLIEVGSTNKTRLSDYRKAIEEEKPGLLLKVSTSNYRIVGFTEEAETSELKKLGNEYGIPVIYDLGSGLLTDLSMYGISGEPAIRESVAAGADIICFSGDKLLGGPQAGIIVGKADMVGKMRKNPLTRAFRIDKLTLAALEATLRLYIEPESAVKYIPTLSMMTEQPDSIKNRAERLFGLLEALIKNGGISIEDGQSQVGGGALPTLNLPTSIIKINTIKPNVQELEAMLRNNSIPVITRIHKDHICLDARTIRDADFEFIVKAFEKIIWE